jgi:ABC-type transporter Mla maintaining outer membrane lipid asymmetry ATPase subunit MlaF
MTAPLLSMEGLKVTLGGRDVLTDATVTLHAGEMLLLLGRSGTGKSVLIKAALGFLPVAAGRVLLHGVPRGVEELRHAVTLVHQAPALLPELDVLHNVLNPLRWREAMGETLSLVRARTALELVGAAHLANAGTAILSAGEQKLVALARAVAVSSEALLLDEPTTGLDVGAARRVGEACARIAAKGTALLVVTHDVAPFAAHANRVALLHGGKVLETGALPGALQAPSPAMRQFLDAARVGPLSSLDGP